MFPTIKNFDMWWKTHSGTMDNRVASIGGSEPEFNNLMFEKKLSSLKDSQESINSCSAWCLENRKHHKKIVVAWLNVLKRVKVEHRLTLFYLANDVIQYSKRKSYDFVESWGTTLQKATTMVREEKVKNKILRIFQIWEQRGVYSEEFIADLSGLISAAPTKKEDLSEFQSSYCVSKIRSCATLEKDTDSKLNKLKEHHPKSIEDLQHFIKDRSHVHDAEQEVEDHIKHIESYVKALQAEIKARAHLISVLTQADKHYEVERKEVKVVVNAYRTFGTKVKAVKKRLDEKIPILQSPVPSPDINAPSPGPDSDIELPGNDNNGSFVAADHQMYTNPGFYNSLSSNETNNFPTNGFSSFLGSSLPFNMQNFDSSTLFSDPSNVGYDPTTLFKPAPPPPPVAPPAITPVPVPSVFDYTANSQSPLMPPPLPPFTTSSYLESTTSYSNSTFSGANTYANTPYQQTLSADNMYLAASQEQVTYQRHPDEYNPEEELETWDNTEAWEVPGIDTPESPPTYEKESFAEPIEYDETKHLQSQGGVDIDQRILLPPMSVSLTGTEQSHRAKDVDHRNLISLTGSPGLEGRSPLLPPPALAAVWGTQGDQDYRTPVNCDSDQDYRVPFKVESENIPLPQLTDSSSPKQDNVESIDMELSDDDDNSPIKCSPEKFSAQYSEDNDFRSNMVLNNNFNLNSIGTQKIETLGGSSHLPALGSCLLEPPPPIPQNLCDIPDIDADANEFLDNLDHDLNNDDFLPGVELPTDVEAVSNFSARNRPPIAAPGLLGTPPGLLPLPEFGKGWSQSGEEWNDPNFMPDKRRSMERGGFRSRGNGNYYDVAPGPPPDHFDDSNHRFRGRGGGRGFRGSRRSGVRGPNPRAFIRGSRGKYRGGFRGGF